ncbi:MAG: hypothetical protein WDM84_09220 [Bauldia sp.]
MKAGALRTIETPDDIVEGLAYLAKRDRRLNAVIKAAGALPLRRRKPGLPGLLRIVTGQQLSVASANAIWTRFEMAFPGMNADALRRAREAPLPQGRHVGRQDQDDPRHRRRRPRRARPRCAGPRSRRRSARGADRDPRHRSVDGRHLSGLLPRPSGHLPGRRTSRFRNAVADAFGCRRRSRPTRLPRSPRPWSPWRSVAATLFWAYYSARKARKGGAGVSPILIDGPRIEPPGGPAKRLVVFLHGYGADGNDLIDIGRLWAPMMRDTAFVSPHAPEPCGEAPMGRQWFPLAGVDPVKLREGVLTAAPVHDAFLDRRAGRPSARRRSPGAGRLQPGRHDGASRGAAPGEGPCRRRRATPASFPGPSSWQRKPASTRRLLLVHGDADPLIPSMALLHRRPASSARPAFPGRMAMSGRG